MPRHQLRTAGLRDGLRAGAVAIVPMSAAMEAIQQMLPRQHREPQEPRQIIETVLGVTGAREQLSERQRRLLSLAAHLGYGAAAGAVYSSMRDRLPLARHLRGPAYGLLLWAAGYVGWLPALGILPPPHRRPAGRNLLLIASHLVWGITADWTIGRCDSRSGASSSPEPAGTAPIT